MDSFTQLPAGGGWGGSHNPSSFGNVAHSLCESPATVQGSSGNVAGLHSHSQCSEWGFQPQLVAGTTQLIWQCSRASLAQPMQRMGICQANANVAGGKPQLRQRGQQRPAFKRAVPKAFGSQSVLGWSGGEMPNSWDVFQISALSIRHCLKSWKQTFHFLYNLQMSL